MRWYQFKKNTPWIVFAVLMMIAFGQAFVLWRAVNAGNPSITDRETDSDLVVHLPLKKNFENLAGGEYVAEATGDTAIHGDGCAVFDGDGDFVTLPHIPLYRRPFAICFWMRIDPGQDLYSLLQQKASAVKNTVLSISVRDEDLRFGFYVNDLSTESKKIQFDTWQHVVCQYTESQEQQIWIDGKLEASRAAFPFLGTRGNTIIGQNPLWSSGKAHDLKGGISDFRIYQRALTQQQVRELADDRPIGDRGMRPSKNAA